MNTYSCLFLMNMYRACQTGMYRLICTDHNPSWIRVHRYISTDCTAYLIIMHQHISHLIHYLTPRNKFTVTVCMIIQTQGIFKESNPTHTRDAQSFGLKTMLKHDSPHSPHVQNCPQCHAFVIREQYYVTWKERRLKDIIKNLWNNPLKEWP